MEPFTVEKLPLKSVEWKTLIPILGKANRALANYNGILYALPNPAVLLSPLTTQEAVLSSRIEGTQATFGEVLRYEAGGEIVEERKRHDIQEIINYRKALRKAEIALNDKPFHLNLLLALHEILLDSVRGRDKQRGQFRNIQNWIGKPGCKIEEADFVPPEPLQVLGLMDNWEKYYHAEEADPLVQLAIVHAQFEVIHPFLDGNGRIGRIIIPLFLYEREVLTKPMFYISSYLEKHRDEYVVRLRDLQNPGNWEKWIAFFLRAVTEQSEENTKKVQQILKLYEQMKERIITLTHSQFAVPLLDHLFKHPIFASNALTIHKTMPSTPMVMILLKKLKDDGILKVLREGSGRRPQILAFAELINLCEGKKVV
jgi:Fic family protein